MTFKIDSAGFYKNRWGSKVHIERCPSSGSWKDNTGRVFNIYGYNALDSSYDIISKWVETPELEDFAEKPSGAQMKNLNDLRWVFPSSRAFVFTEKGKLAMPNIGQKFYLVFNPQQSAPTRQHKTLEEAKTEAKRIAVKHPKQEVYVLETVACYNASVDVQEVVVV